MDHRTKGFTLIEMLAALVISALLITLGVPAFSRLAQSTRADTEIGEVQRALNFARIEAINRGITTQLRPTADRDDWQGELAVYDGTGTSANVLRVVPAVSKGATVTLTSGVSSIDFSDLGGLSSVPATVLISYTLGAQSRTLSVCLNGRILRGGSCE
ncbi:GspH/FimT family pseudopilin [Pseudomonas vancouverensis]|uniref:Type II secretion system protein H n=1 Tax=Pseudomonas vancouverensis TaxID=95300 RepID=A0A1H2PHQ7_PSEVA|nr:GspH/FimT family pseudopilin [Pseudomonas vancouverensis]KAB0492580.1 prepilin-type N-terminal cleavage/methylation domain-containing protein [Pseudomonas vancouverensis]TDB58470.1 prepilin-type N-terminal cleavage/methylation domain-containing protein [Pseudomonas vancouverensis]SDV17269.1 type IV fimbrial biogenesis protein FimU [Pseudomonas vancouverensis]